MVVFLLALGMLCLNQIDAMVCSIGLEPDPSSDNRYRWVIPVEDPCKCTDIRPGGMNTGTPGRNFNVIYFDIFISTAHEVHALLNCSSKWTGSRMESTPLITDGMPSASDPQSTTNVVLLQLEGTKCDNVNSYVADPVDCAVFYECIWGFLVKKTCGTLYFNTNSNTCDHTFNVPCPIT